MIVVWIKARGPVIYQPNEQTKLQETSWCQCILHTGWSLGRKKPLEDCLFAPKFPNVEHKCHTSKIFWSFQGQQAGICKVKGKTAHWLRLVSCTLSCSCLWKGQLLHLAWPPTTPAEACKTEFLGVSPSLCSQVAFVVCHAYEFNGPHATSHQLGSPTLIVTGLYTGSVIQGIHGRVKESGLARFIIKY